MSVVGLDTSFEEE
jgi:hypothetical protein